MKNLFKKLLITSLLVTTFNASAAVISFTDSFGTQGSSTDVTLSGLFSETLQIQGFDSALGTLTNVAISVSAQLNSTGSSQNISVSNGRAEIDVTMILPFEVSSAFTNAFTFVAADPINSFLNDESAPTGTFDLIPATADDTFSYGLSTGQIDGSLTATSLASFVTAGTIDFVFTALANTAFTNDVDGGTGLFTNSFTTAAWGEITVEYTYSTAPAVTVSAPTSLAAFGLLLIGFAVSRKVKS
ncbi:choice-of-anchor E domain-containing protein [Alteromonas sp. KUL49]|uniref:choice-of-anchor E domain-containing protein n=1 Tax=Alteromonas sp. KUL49 TaxID=2480798 RepID=UPI00102F1E8F|nr:choice-of-anchor E domain-containing protein [Alteromonas sp. KUL49]TAP42484.1 choice-of-anchor E domain-containing protein [Alteromonas sp. KUL49]GEA10107.1 hypothetical protein KUL49_04820 [Alteromonas sp. KUL49]